MVYALIKNGVVENTIVADANFISLINSQWDNCIRIDELEIVPGIGWTHDGSVFTNPEEVSEDSPPEP
jgi:hypothetical protein